MARIKKIANNKLIKACHRRTQINTVENKLATNPIAIGYTNDTNKRDICQRNLFVFNCIHLSAGRQVRVIRVIRGKTKSCVSSSNPCLSVRSLLSVACIYFAAAAATCSVATLPGYTSSAFSRQSIAALIASTFST